MHLKTCDTCAYNLRYRLHRRGILRRREAFHMPSMERIRLLPGLRGLRLRPSRRRPVAAVLSPQLRYLPVNGAGFDYVGGWPLGEHQRFRNDIADDGPTDHASTSIAESIDFRPLLANGVRTMEPESTARTLIRDRWVLTAAHCFGTAKDSVQSYEVWSLASRDQDSWNRKSIDLMVVHPGYDMNSLDNDIDPSSCMQHLSSSREGTAVKCQDLAAAMAHR
eukprot:s2683_g11.t1